MQALWILLTALPVYLSNGKPSVTEEVSGLSRAHCGVGRALLRPWKKVTTLDGNKGKKGTGSQPQRSIEPHSVSSFSFLLLPLPILFFFEVSWRDVLGWSLWGVGFATQAGLAIQTEVKEQRFACFESYFLLLSVNPLQKVWLLSAPTVPGSRGCAEESVSGSSTSRYMSCKCGFSTGSIQKTHPQRHSRRCSRISSVHWRGGPEKQRPLDPDGPLEAVPASELLW